MAKRTVRRAASSLLRGASLFAALVLCSWAVLVGWGANNSSARRQGSHALGFLKDTLWEVGPVFFIASCIDVLLWSKPQPDRKARYRPRDRALLCAITAVHVAVSLGIIAFRSFGAERHSSSDLGANVARSLNVELCRPLLFLCFFAWVRARDRPYCDERGAARRAWLLLRHPGTWVGPFALVLQIAVFLLGKFFQLHLLVAARLVPDMARAVLFAFIVPVVGLLLWDCRRQSTEYSFGYVLLFWNASRSYSIVQPIFDAVLSIGAPVYDHWGLVQAALMCLLFLCVKLILVVSSRMGTAGHGVYYRFAFIVMVYKQYAWMLLYFVSSRPNSSFYLLLTAQCIVSLAQLTGTDRLLLQLCFSRLRLVQSRQWLKNICTRSMSTEDWTRRIIDTLHTALTVLGMVGFFWMYELDTGHETSDVCILVKISCLAGTAASSDSQSEQLVTRSSFFAMGLSVLFFNIAACAVALAVNVYYFGASLGLAKTSPAQSPASSPLSPRVRSLEASEEREQEPSQTTELSTVPNLLADVVEVVSGPDSSQEDRKPALGGTGAGPQGAAPARRGTPMLSEAMKRPSLLAVGVVPAGELVGMPKGERTVDVLEFLLWYWRTSFVVLLSSLCASAIAVVDLAAVVTPKINL
eukprot:m51a1_g8080 hypothetical protein (638) ;mRNA; r:4896-7278